VLGGSNARCWSLTLRSPGSAVPPPMYVIANEQGYLAAPAATSRLTFCPGERYEVVIDFTNFRSRQVFFYNDAGAPFPNGVTPQSDPASRFLATPMRFDVTRPLNAAVPAGPYVAAGKTLVPVAPLAATAGLPARDLVLNEVTDANGAPVRVQIDGKAFEAPVTETPRRGAVEVWRFLNTTVDAHPIHLHLVKFQVVSRQRFDSRQYVVDSGIDQLFGAPAGFEITKPPLAGYLLGAPRTPSAIERGWKDTVIALPGEVTTVIAEWDGRWNDCAAGSTPNVDPATGLGGTCKFPAPWADAPANTISAPYFENVTSGPYVWHCHIVDHEDNEMMRPSLVMP
jgi:FtsP/CotA-like multicopper oxidase with cupredoxin domain